MKKFASTNGFLAIAFYVIQLVGGFVIGATILSRYDGNDDFSPESLPSSAIAGGLETALGIAFVTTLGFVFRYLTYRLMDAAGAANQTPRIVVIVIEVLYAALNLFLVWAATEPIIDAGMLWIFVMGLGGVVTALSFAALVGAYFATRRRRSEHGLVED